MNQTNINTTNPGLGNEPGGLINTTRLLPGISIPRALPPEPKTNTMQPRTNSNPNLSSTTMTQHQNNALNGHSHGLTNEPNSLIEPLAQDDYCDIETAPKNACRLPLWARSGVDTSTLKWDRTNRFWYETDDDYQNGLSYRDRHRWYGDEESQDAVFITFRHHAFGSLRVEMVGGIAWCLLDDAAELTGHPTQNIVGWWEDEDGNHVRGISGVLKPNGIRWLGGDGSGGYGIRLDALVHFAEVRRVHGGRHLTKWLKQDVIQGLTDHPEKTADYASEAAVAPMASAGQVRLDKFFNPSDGGFHTVRLGTNTWVAVDDISRATGHPKKVITRIAGRGRTVSIPNSAISNAVDSRGTGVYIRFDAVAKLIQASEYLPSWGHWLEMKMLTTLLDDESLLASGAFVMASTLHRMLCPKSSFTSWIAEVASKNPNLILGGGEIVPSETASDFRIPATAALKIARLEKSNAAMFVGTLLFDGGYVHGGPLDEPAEATLRRFFGLIRSRRGRVSLRKALEFDNVLRPERGCRKIREQDMDVILNSPPVVSVSDWFLGVACNWRRTDW